MRKLNLDLLEDLQEVKASKLKENGDKSYNTTGNHLVDLMFMAEYFTANPSEVKIGDSDKEKLFAMYMRDAVYGKGYRVTVEN